MDALNGREMTLGITEPKDFKQKVHRAKISAIASTLEAQKFYKEFDALQKKYNDTPFNA